MRDVILCGELGKRYGRRHRLAVKSPAEAMRAMCANHPTFEKDVIEIGNAGIGYAVFNGRSNVGSDELTRGGSGKIIIAPVMSGRKKGGVLQIIAGVVLVIVGAVIDYVTAGTAGNPLIAGGISLIAGGVVQLLTPLPQAPKNDSGGPNNTFDGPINTTAQGYPVPLGYGLALTGSAVISAGIIAEDVAAT